MAYKVLKGVFLTDKLLNAWKALGATLFTFEEHQGLYNIILHAKGSLPQADKNGMPKK